jgi:hypothetical protein
MRAEVIAPDIQDAHTGSLYASGQPLGGNTYPTTTLIEVLDPGD